MKAGREPESWVVEGIMTTMPAPSLGVGAEGQRLVNIATMGPIVDAGMTRFILRPFKTSTTYKNIHATDEGIFHVTDDALMLARAAIGRVRSEGLVPMRPAKVVRGMVLTGACRYFELRVQEMFSQEERATIVMAPVGGGTLRDYLGFNRAKHAVVEAAILATRLHLTGAPAVLEEYTRLQTAVERTGSVIEMQAMKELREYVETHAISVKQPRET